MPTVVLDPGHGGSEEIGGSSPNNAAGPSGALEKNLTLRLALLAEPLLLANGHSVILTRKSDKNLGLAARARIARRNNAEVFLAIHFNGLDGRVQGTESFCHSDHTRRSAALCRAVQAAVVKVTGYEDRNAKFVDGVKTDSFGVLRRDRHATITACCLLEVSFMDVPDDDRRLQDPVYFASLATAIVSGIQNYLDGPE